MMEVHRGEVFYADLSPVVGSEQGGVRPVLIVQNDIGNRHSPTVIAAAIMPPVQDSALPKVTPSSRARSSTRRARRRFSSSMLSSGALAKAEHLT